MAISASHDIWTSIADQSNKIACMVRENPHPLDHLREETAELQVLLSEAARLQRNLGSPMRPG